MKIEVKKLSEKEIDGMGIKSWGVWQKEPSVFDWHYDEKESCLFLEGRVIVKTDDGEVEIKKGDFAIFPEGLSCVWDVKEAVKKHFKFG